MAIAEPCALALATTCLLIRWFSLRRKFASLLRILDSLRRALGAASVEASPMFRIVLSGGFHLRSGKRLAIGVDGDVDNTQVDADHVGRLDRTVLGHVDRAEQVELALPADEIRLPLDAALPVLLVGTQTKGISNRPESDHRLTVVSPLKLITRWS